MPYVAIKAAGMMQHTGDYHNNNNIPFSVKVSRSVPRSRV